MSNQKHPKGLYLLFFTETWERFSYYGMRAIFVLYLIKALQYTGEAASQLYGSFTGLVYLTPLIGGYVADRYWGNRRSIIIGGLIMALAQLFMFASASFYTNLDVALPLMFVGLGLLIFGNGFFKPCASTLVGQLYPKDDPRINSAFTIFYMGVNLGAMMSPLICGTLGDTGDPGDFKWGFLASSIGMVVSIIIFYILKDRYLVAPDGRPVGVIPAKKNKDMEVKRDDNKVIKDRHPIQYVLYIFGAIAIFCGFYFGIGFDFFGSLIFSACLVVPTFVFTDPSLTKIERERIMVVYILAFFVIFFWSAFEQAGASLTIFADQQTDRFIGGWEMPASYFQSFNALFIVILAPLFASLWPLLARKKMDPISPVKQAIGLFLLAMGYLFIAFGVKGVEPGMKVSMMWLVGLYFIHTLGELCLSPIGLSIVNRLSPARFASLMMGVWYLSNATANKFGGMLSALYPHDGVARNFLGYSITNMYDFFILFVFMAGTAAFILFGLSFWLKKKMHGIK